MGAVNQHTSMLIVWLRMETDQIRMYQHTSMLLTTMWG
jgi:hypothetical protein